MSERKSAIVDQRKISIPILSEPLSLNIIENNFLSHYDFDLYMQIMFLIDKNRLDVIN